jgi:hypothetical protein
MKLTPSSVCLLTREGLVALDPLTGRTLWQRPELSPRGLLSADDRHLFAVELSKEISPTATHAFRLSDGMKVSVKDCTDRLSRRGTLVAGRVLWSEAAPGKEVTLGAYDVLTGKDVWTRSYPAGCRVLESHSPGYLGVLDPESRVSIVAADSGAELANTVVRDVEFERQESVALRFDKLTSAYLLADTHRFYVICNEPNHPEVVRVKPNIEGGIRARSLPVNGFVFAIDRESKARVWIKAEKNQMLLLDHFAEMPLLLLSSRYDRQWRQSDRDTVAYVRATDKKSGRLLWDDAYFRGLRGAPLHTLRYNPESGRVDLESAERKLIFEPRDKK